MVAQGHLWGLKGPSLRLIEAFSAKFSRPRAVCSSLQRGTDPAAAALRTLERSLAEDARRAWRAFQRLLVPRGKAALDCFLFQVKDADPADQRALVVLLATFAHDDAYDQWRIDAADELAQRFGWPSAQAYLQDDADSPYHAESDAAGTSPVG